jgi:hypothetical protein
MKPSRTNWKGDGVLSDGEIHPAVLKLKLAPILMKSLKEVDRLSI